MGRKERGGRTTNHGETEGLQGRHGEPRLAGRADRDGFAKDWEREDGSLVRGRTEIKGREEER